MPVYTYRCSECGSELELQQGFEDEPPTTCPVCGKEALHKVYTPVGIVFKGSGFYSTDHRPSSGGSKNGKSTSKSDAAPDAKSEAKPAPPAPPKDE